MPLEPRSLQAFLAIVEAGSLGRAAASLHLTQPALSRIIKRLEGEVGVALFDAVRQRRGHASKPV